MQTVRPTPETRDKLIDDVRRRGSDPQIVEMNEAAREFPAGDNAANARFKRTLTAQAFGFTWFA